MNRKIIFAIIPSLLLMAAVHAQTPTINNFNVEYGTVEYKTTRGKNIFHFKDNGNRFRNEIFDSAGSLVSAEIYDGTNLYSIQNGKVDTMGLVRNKYFRSADPNGFKRNSKFKKLPTKTIADRQCEGFEYFNSVTGRMITIYGWNGIIMQNTVEDDVPTMMEAVKFDPARPSVSFRLD